MPAVTTRRIVVGVLVVGVLFLGWRALIDAGEWQACGASTGQAVGGALGKGEPSTLECVAVALAKPVEVRPDSESGFAPAGPDPAPAVTGEPEEDPPVCGDPGLGAYSFTGDGNGCEVEIAERAAPDDGALPGPLPGRYADVPEIGCSIDPAGVVEPCTSVYIPDRPDDGVCVELRWTGSKWQPMGSPAAFLCPNHRGA